MGEALSSEFAYVRELFEEVSERSRVDFSATFFGDGSPHLHDDLPAQVGVFAVSLAVLDVLRREHHLVPSAVAGYSLGTYAAFVAAGVLDRDHALDVLLAAQRLLEASGERGGMGFVIGLRRPEIDSLLAEVNNSFEPSAVSVGTENAAQQFVLTGNLDAVEEAIKRAAPNALRSEMLPLSWPMHSRRLSGVSRGLRDYIRQHVRLASPSYGTALFAPTSGGPISSSEEAFDVLAEQISRPSRWREVLTAMSASGHSTFAELGPGDVLSKILRWSVRRCRPNPLETPEAIAAFAKTLNNEPDEALVSHIQPAPVETQLGDA